MPSFVPKDERNLKRKELDGYSSFNYIFRNEIEYKLEVLNYEKIILLLMGLIQHLKFVNHRGNILALHSIPHRSRICNTFYLTLNKKYTLICAGVIIHIWIFKEKIKCNLNLNYLDNFWLWWKLAGEVFCCLLALGKKKKRPVNVKINLRTV